MIIDIHTHTFPDHMAPGVLNALIEKTRDTINLQAAGSGTLSGLLSTLESDGIDRAVICPIATHPKHFTHILRFIEDLAEGTLGTHARERIIPAGSIHPHDPDMPQRVRTLARAGARIIKIHPYYQETVLTDLPMMRLLECCCSENLPVISHTGYDIGFSLTPMCTPGMVREVNQTFPELVFIAAHCAAWRCEEEALETLLGTSAHLDISFQPTGGQESTIRRFVTEHPAHLLYFASDWPWRRPGELVGWLRDLNLPPEREDAILGGNAARVLRLDSD